MGAPRKKVHAKPTNLTIDPAIKRLAKKLAITRGYSLSEYVQRLLEKEIESNKIDPKDLK